MLKSITKHSILTLGSVWYSFNGVTAEFQVANDYLSITEAGILRTDFFHSCQEEVKSYTQNTENYEIANEEYAVII